jgi:hypothetical protein
MRYIVATPPVVVRDPMTDEPSALVIPWSDAMRLLFRDQRLTQQLDVLSLLDLRKKLIRAQAGDVVELAEDEWSAVLVSLRQPVSFSPEYIHSAEDFFRAFLNAPTEKPAPVAAAE